MTRPYIFDSEYTALSGEDAGFVVTASRGNEDAFGLERVEAGDGCVCEEEWIVGRGVRRIGQG